MEPQLRRRIVPTRATLALVVAWLVIGLVAALLPPWLVAWEIVGALCAAALLADALAALTLPSPPAIERRVAHNLAVGQWAPTELRLSRALRTLRGVLHDAYPDSFEASGLPRRFELGVGEALVIGYRVRPLTRGPHRYGTVTLRADSPLRLWQRVLVAGDASDVRVYPDFAKVTQYAFLATDHRLTQIGVLQRRRRGEGLDFHQLREYRVGDTSRQIDWKATARARRLISREYQDERDQRIVFLLDCGQRMRAREGALDDTDRALSHFDHTVNALLLLAYVALRQGDAVGVMTFGHPAPRYFAPRKSVAMVNVILNGLYDLEPTTSVPDYLGASEDLHVRLTKRALVIVLTNLRDEDDALLLPAMALLRRRHLTLLANLREPSLERIVRGGAPTFDAALTYGAAADYIRTRETTLARLRHRGVEILEGYPRDLPRLLVNRYWDMKRAGRI
jgi:uncharacterized protein (DUF58 family)